MRTVLLAICLAAFTPLNAIAADNVEKNNSNVHATQKQHTNAIEIILDDHKKVKSTIANLEKNLHSNVAKARDIFKELKTLLENHEAMEEKTWYPELEKNDDLKNIISKLKEEEETAGKEIKEIDGITDDKEWVAKVQKLIKDVKAHAHDEETKLFPKVKKEFDKAKLNEIGEKMQEFKNEHKS
jgi:hemerythrin superfamily protein